MSKISFEHKFDYGQKVYHIADTEGRSGVISDLCYFARNKEMLYLVTLGFTEEAWVGETELTTTRPVS